MPGQQGPSDPPETEDLQVAMVQLDRQVLQAQRAPQVPMVQLDQQDRQVLQAQRAPQVPMVQLDQQDQQVLQAQRGRRARAVCRFLRERAVQLVEA
jgi:hypothetical protein